ncbi:MAG: hypothetical protein IJI05_02945, partial [Erysipelotrichaceae bacterium]|nr:hypothetical protein [Erysipelotrichaceae bacterium]
KYELVQGDRVFPLHTDCDNCVCTIYSPLPLQETETAVQLKAGHLRFSFVNETAREIAQIADSFRKGQLESDGYYRKGIE